jgi:hypothetical protein
VLQGWGASLSDVGCREKVGVEYETEGGREVEPSLLYPSGDAWSENSRRNEPRSAACVEVRPAKSASPAPCA